MKKTLIESLPPNTSTDVIRIICEFSCLSTLKTKENLENTSIIIEKSYFIELLIDVPILELVVRNCGECKFQFSNVHRMCRAYYCINNEFYCKGECTSFRFERCDNILVHVWDHFKRTLFLSLYTNCLDIQMFNAYFPNDNRKCVGSFQNFVNDDNVDDEENVNENEMKIETDDNNNGGVSDNSAFVQSLKERIEKLTNDSSVNKKKKKKKWRIPKPEDLLKLRFAGNKKCFICIWRLSKDEKKFDSSFIYENSSLMTAFQE